MMGTSPSEATTDTDSKEGQQRAPSLSDLSATAEHTKESPAHKVPVSCSALDCDGSDRLPAMQALLKTSGLLEGPAGTFRCCGSLDIIS